MKVEVQILWIDGDIGYGRSAEYGDFCLMPEDVEGHKEGDIIEVEDEDK